MNNEELENQQERKVTILYTNYRGETDVRHIVPIEMVFASTEYHPVTQWLLRAYDLDRKEERRFACKDIKAWAAAGDLGIGIQGGLIQSHA